LRKPCRLSGQKFVWAKKWPTPLGRPFFRMCFITGLVPGQLLVPERLLAPEQLLAPDRQQVLQQQAPGRQQELQQQGPELLLLFWRSQ